MGTTLSLSGWNPTSQLHTTDPLSTHKTRIIGKMVIIHVFFHFLFRILISSLFAVFLHLTPVLTILKSSTRKTPNCGGGKCQGGPCNCPRNEMIGLFISFPGQFYGPFFMYCTTPLVVGERVNGTWAKRISRQCDMSLLIMDRGHQWAGLGQRAGL